MSGQSPGRERRLVTVLFADLSGFTSAAESRDPEEVHAFLSELMAHLHGIVESFGGTIVNTMGDGFLAVFGAPVAHPDDAERGVRAALATREAAREFEHRSFAPIELHAGVHSGWVFIAPSKSGFDVVGDTVNTASRVAQVAGPGTVLAGELTRALTASVIRYRELEPVRVKGKVDPLPVYEAVDVRTSASQDLFEPAGMPLVGREPELAQLAAIGRTVAETGRSEVVVIAGAPGIGKSRLAAEFTARVPGSLVLVGRSVPFGDRIPWLGVTHAVRSVAGISEVEATATARDKLAECVDGALRGADVEERSRVAHNLGLILGIEESAATSRAAPGEFSWEIAAAVRSLLSSLATSRPVVLILEDLQWADPEVVSFLRWVQEEPWPAPVLFVGLAWDDAMADLRLDGATLVSLGGLARDDSDLLLRTLLPDADVPPDVAEDLAERAGGNPLFLQEIVRLLKELGSLRVHEGRWSLAARATPEVPETVHLVVAARIDALSPDERRLVRDAAVCGRSFTPALLEALGWGDEARELLVALRRRDLIFERGEEFVFRHAVIRDVAYDAIPRVERAERHLAVAEWIRKRSEERGEDPVEMLGYHYGQAAAVGFSAAQRSIAPLAVTYLTRAGDRAAHKRAVREAESWYRQALEVEPPVPSRAVSERGRRTLAALVNHAEVLFHLSRYAEAREEASRALEMARIAGDAAFEAEALLQLARLDSLYGEVSGARAMLVTAGARFEEAKDDGGGARVVRAMADTWRLADIDRMIEMLSESAVRFAAAGDWLNELFVYEDLAYVYTTRAGPDFAQWFAKGEALLSRTNDRRSLAVLNRTKGFRAFYQGAFDVAADLLENAMTLGSAVGDVFVEMDGRFLLARIRLKQGDLAGAAELAHAMVRFGSAQKIRRTEEEGLVVLALVAAREGRGDEATQFLAHAHSLLAGIGAEREMSEVVRAAGELALEQGLWQQALTSAAAFAAECRRYADTLEEPRALLLAARAHLGSGDFSAAMRASEQAFALAREFDERDVLEMAGPLLAEARVLAGERSGDERWPSSDPRFPEPVALAAEARGVRAAVEGDRPEAMRQLDTAVAAWQRLGLSIWLARALAMKASLGDADAEQRSKEVLAMIGRDVPPASLSPLPSAPQAS